MQLSLKVSVAVSLGPHHEWSCDSHDKLSAIGFPIWGVRDVWSKMWLGLWVVPNNQLLKAIAYLYLSLIVELEGMPLQSTTDCGLETTLMFGLANALREQFSPELNEVNIGPAHCFMKSVHNITIERGWNQVHNKWGTNIKMFWENSAEVYDSSNPVQYELVQWLWPKLIQEELDHFRKVNNDHKPKKMTVSKLPSGVSPHIAFTLPEKYGSENCLQPLSITVVQGLMEDLGGEEFVQFVSPEYAAHAEEVFNSLGVEELTTANIWNVFTAMLPHM
ncbi:uncharacterized protein LACBIDRAFT_303846 [Laccaria bicolor S238N-H82]|uniref:Predicted protein n=1 Tax=Laccaria bicolor (strain S238N-H82 / ATCC MYA-4686) TaxID=486041 RepID=B0DKH0_LACBS|nr:uncharacterized protein LACBIDRAFT_303846 [Laccaria bicolor S238N-H82]EDR05062.1 predicted protein [Laccaria bicolor S238N-H82]|eukprot:XP_001884452.1 predicted protein [Laccaria bicolor S238N-H82]